VDEEDGEADALVRLRYLRDSRRGERIRPPRVETNADEESARTNASGATWVVKRTAVAIYFGAGAIAPALACLAITRSLILS
jgi:hypothetical protein